MSSHRSLSPSQLPRADTSLPKALNTGLAHSSWECGRREAERSSGEAGQTSQPLLSLLTGPWPSHLSAGHGHFAPKARRGLGKSRSCLPIPSPSHLMALVAPKDFKDEEQFCLNSSRPETTPHPLVFYPNHSVLTRQGWEGP